MFKVFRYSLAAIVAALAILVAARRFGDTFSQSVISVGRNPLARSQIRSMVVWNSFLIILISCVGFGISALIIFVP
jgi:F0F1-type ATP synthase membrane subunit c/vacuolar-type H+-ATPase subunit K